jgi:hypothetical protein
MDAIAANPKKRRAPGVSPRSRPPQQKEPLAYSVFGGQDLFPPGPRVPYFDTMDMEEEDDGRGCDLSPPDARRTRTGASAAPSSHQVNPMNDLHVTSTTATDNRHDMAESSHQSTDSDEHQQLAPQQARLFWLPILPSSAVAPDENDRRSPNPAARYLESLYCARTVTHFDPTKITHINPHNGMLIHPVRKADATASAAVSQPRSVLPTPLSHADQTKLALGMYTESVLNKLGSGLKRWATDNLSRSGFSPPPYARRPQNAVAAAGSSTAGSDEVASSSLEWKDLVDPTVESSWVANEVPFLAGSFAKVDESYNNPASVSSFGDDQVAHDMNLLSNTVGPFIKLCHWICMLFESSTGIVEQYAVSPQVDPDSVLHAVARIMLALLTFMDKPEAEFSLENRLPATQIGCYSNDGGPNQTVTLRTLPSGEGNNDDDEPTRRFTLLDCMPFMRSFLSVLAMMETSPDDGDDDELSDSPSLTPVIVSDGMHSLSGIARAIGVGDLADPLILVTSMNMPSFGMLMKRSQYNQLVYPFLPGFLNSSYQGRTEYRLTVYVTTIGDEDALRNNDDATLPPNYMAAYPSCLRAALCTAQKWGAENGHALYSPSSIHILNPSPFAGGVCTLMPIEVAGKAWAPLRSLMDKYSPGGPPIAIEEVLHATNPGVADPSSSLSTDRPHHHAQKIGESQTFFRATLTVVPI